MSVMIIAEAGINHGRLIHNAFRLVDAAKECRADVVKFQLEQPTEYTLTPKQIAEVYRYCEDVGIKFACTAFDNPCLRFLLENTKMEFVKFASTQWQDVAKYKIADESGLPIIQSIVSPIKPIQEVKKLRFLHCVPEYPTPLDHCNLNRVAEPWCNGISDHSGNPLIPALAVALGAEIIECHLKLGDDDIGPDMSSSLNPEQFKLMVSYARQAEAACNTTASQRRRAGL